ncbi:MAG: RIP metalloprotease RseP [Rhodocyclaceae bacterium]|nr:RIP metalloprotease RseP [Rhodocyclaceae bacterium]
MNFAHLPSYLGAFVLALGILIFFHELGHFLAARACGVKVLKFSVGFGRSLLSRRFGADGTEWTLAIFPLGGYVRMLDEREGPVEAHEAHRAFNRQSVWRRIIVVAAGPAANFVLAILLYWVLFIHGVEELRPWLGQPPVGTPAAVAEVQEGDLVRTVNGQPVLTWAELRWEVLKAGADHQPVTLETLSVKNQIAFRRLATDVVQFDKGEGDPLAGLGLRLRRPLLPPVIGKIMPGSVAEVAGLRVMDRFLAVNGQDVHHWHEVADVIRRSAGREVVLVFEREGRQLEIRVVPAEVAEGKEHIGRIGMQAWDDPNRKDDMTITVSYGMFAAVGKAMAQTWETSVFSLVMMGRMITGDVSWKNLSGPVTIADIAGQSARLGFAHYIKFIALISLSLGVLNLLPIPILDGGHLMYYLAEIIKGGPLSERAMEIGQQIGLVILGLLMAFAFYNDINRLISG